MTSYIIIINWIFFSLTFNNPFFLSSLLLINSIGIELSQNVDWNIMNVVGVAVMSLLLRVCKSSSAILQFFETLAVIVEFL